jgi:hypothetical protein
MLEESEKIYYSIFQKKIPSFLKDHFIVISRKVDSNHSEREVHEYYRYLKRVTDLEALELTARYLKRLPLLSKKFQIMIFLAETLPENYDCYINNKDNAFQAYLSIFFYGFYSIYKFIKGMILLGIY